MQNTPIPKRFNRKIVIVTGELSGEIHAARLVAALLKDLDFEISGMGSTMLREAGVNVICDYKNISVTGLSEVVRKFASIREAFNKVKKHILDVKPGLVILVDFPGFNMRIARFARGIGIPVVYFIPPQVWAWRKGRMRSIKRFVDKVLCVLPFEKELYDQYGIDAAFVGHPFAHDVHPLYTREKFFDTVGIPSDHRLLTIMPGSRENEIVKHLPIMLDVIEIIKKEVEPLSIVLPVADNINQQLIDELMHEKKDVRVVRGMSHDALAYSNAALIASGSATLEAAVLGTPSVVIYKISSISYLAARMLVNINFISLPNIIYGAEVFPEIIQHLEAKKIAEKVINMLQNECSDIKDALGIIKERLGTGNAYASAKKYILEFLNQHYGSIR